MGLPLTKHVFLKGIYPWLDVDGFDNNTGSFLHLYVKSILMHGVDRYFLNSPPPNTHYLSTLKILFDLKFYNHLISIIYSF